MSLLTDDVNTLKPFFVQGAHRTKTIPHCYIVRGQESGGAEAGSFGVVEWHGHPARLEAALGYLMDEDEDRQEGESGVETQQVPVAVPVEG